MVTSDVSLAKGHRFRLRERFLKGGAAALADYELLEMLLFAAHPRGDVKPLAKQVLKHFGGLANAVQAPISEYEKVDGLGDAGIAALKAAEEVSARLLRAKAERGPVLSNWTALLDYCTVRMANEKIEQFRILFLNQKNELIVDEIQQTGTINHTPVYPREVLKRALELGAASIILAHNHPSGDSTPSKMDIDITRQIVQALAPIDINVHDHLIIGRHGHYSFKSHGLM